MVSNSSKIVAIEDQVYSQLSGESIILNLKSGVYYGLNHVGAKIWQMIQEPKTVNQVRDAVVREYNVEPERCDRDILTLVEQLAEVGLVEVIN